MLRLHAGRRAPLRYAVTAAVVAGLVLAGCSAPGQDADPTPTTRTQARETAPRTSPRPPDTETSTATATPDPEPDAETEPDMVEARQVTPRLNVTVSERVEQEFELPGADWLVASAGWVWVKRADGHLDRVDPLAGEVTASIELHGEGQECSGLGAWEHSLWVCAGGGDVALVDPWSATVIAVVEADKTFEQGHIPVAFEHAWVLTGDGSTLAGINMWTQQVSVEHALPTVCTDLAASAEALWAACPYEGVVLRIDPQTGQETGRVEDLAGTRTLVADDSIYAGYAGGTARIDIAEAELTGAIDIGPGASAGSLHASGGSVWIRTEGTFLRLFDGRAMDFIEEIAAPQTSGGSVLLAYGSLWATAYGDDILYRLTPSRFPGLTEQAAREAEDAELATETATP